MRLTTTTNFSFMKLRNKIEKHLSDGARRITRSAAKGAKERISKGLSPPLKKSTLELRRARGIGGSKPLFATGELHKSIRPTEDGLEMNKYGWYHQQGFMATNVPIGFNRKTDGKSSNFNWKESEPIFPRNKRIQRKVPARPFIFPSQKEILDPMKKTLI